MGTVLFLFHFFLCVTCFVWVEGKKAGKENGGQKKKEVRWKTLVQVMNGFVLPFSEPHTYVNLFLIKTSSITRSYIALAGFKPSENDLSAYVGKI